MSHSQNIANLEGQIRDTEIELGTLGSLAGLASDTRMQAFLTQLDAAIEGEKESLAKGLTCPSAYEIGCRRGFVQALMHVGKIIRKPVEDGPTVRIKLDSLRQRLEHLRDTEMAFGSGPSIDDDIAEFNKERGEYSPPKQP